MTFPNGRVTFPNGPVTRPHDDVKFPNDSVTLPNDSVTLPNGSATRPNDRGTRPNGSWLAQAHQFYTNALADAAVLAALGRFGISQEKLVAGQAQVDAVAGLAAAQKKETGEAQQATQTRDAALEENPQWLEKMGILARA